MPISHTFGTIIPGRDTVAAAFLCIAVSALSIAAQMAAPFTASQSVMDKYKKKGLSLVEYEMIRDARMPDSKVDELLKAGISITEYFKYPWLKYGITEKDWIKRRRSGLLESDIARSQVDAATPEGGAIVASFFVPGLYQFKREQYAKGGLMTGGAVLGLGLMTGISIARKNFSPEPLLIMVPCMLWSSVDIGFQIHKEGNPNAQRFTLKFNGMINLAGISLPIKGRNN